MPTLNVKIIANVEVPDAEWERLDLEDRHDRVSAADLAVQYLVADPYTDVEFDVIDR